MKRGGGGMTVQLLLCFKTLGWLCLCVFHGKAFLAVSSFVSGVCVCLLQLLCYPVFLSSSCVSGRVRGCACISLKKEKKSMLFICQEEDTSPAVLPSKGGCTQAPEYDI